MPSAISFAGFDCYTQSDDQATQNFLSKHRIAQSVWIAETWSQPSENSNPQTDPAWLLSEYNFAVQIHASEIMPFYTDNFASYSQPITNFVASTPVAREFHAIISANG
ncbi:MAG TPA: hypothetical protein VFF30_19505 [Nitrososphaerales archaeon]|nr:hypothetical protein [Nitrososphaerales archaeon]